MEYTKDAPPAKVSSLRIGTERDVAGKLIPVSLSWLQKDRKGAQTIPFIKMGDRVLYDLDAVEAAVRALSVGGPRGRRAR